MTRHEIDPRAPWRPRWPSPLPYGPILTAPHGDGSRGWAMLARVALAHELDIPEVEAPYAYGVVDMPDAGGYMVAAVVDDGATLCARCLADPSCPAHPPTGDRGDDHDGWTVIGWTHSGELDGPDWCEHCGREWTGHEGDDA